MIYPEIRHIHSPDLDPPNMPEDPSDCEISFQAFVGPKDGDGEEAFNFTVVTSARLVRESGARWGRGKLIVPAFEWPAVVQALAQLLANCARPTWAEVAEELNKELIWEFDGCKPPDGEHSDDATEDGH
ncbi:MAG: immunity 8 family protein [Acidobacteria bacterium]|nr:immunity 8 family protein [Acidobacteriota bacterium]MCI0722652.1 immunity 8 family protein [Acidobacteriota bacterium]